MVHYISLPAFFIAYVIHMMMGMVSCQRRGVERAHIQRMSFVMN